MKIFIWLFFLSFIFTGSNLIAATTEESMAAGKAAYQSGDIPTAVKQFQAAVQSDPNNWQALQNLGYCLYQSNQFPESLDAYQKSLVLHPDPATQAFVDKLKEKVNEPPAPVPMAVAASAPTTQATAPNTDRVSDFYAAKRQEDKDREELKLYGETHQLTQEQTYIANWGAPPSDFREPHFDIETGLWYLDIGVNIEPTINLGIDFLYIPLNQVDYNYSGNYDEIETLTNIPGNFIYLQPRIKFYTSPSGLSSYHGFSFTYCGLSQGADSAGYQPTNFSILALGYLFGFRTLPKDGWTMELGFQVGVAVIFDLQQVDSYTYTNGTYTDSYTNQTTVVPFPYILPEWRFGYTF